LSVARGAVASYLLPMAEAKGRSGKDAPKKGTAPSAANLDDLEKMEASPEAQAATPSEVDAMGQDKRRAVVGHSYGPSRRSQVIFFVAVAAVLLVVVGGWFVAVAAFDTSPEEYPDEAPWSAADTPQNVAAQSGGYQPRSPDGPCGEPGNPFPQTEGTPCAAEETSGDQPPVPGGESPGPIPGSGGVTNSGGEAK
jgi:hypothetical protein